MKPGRDLDALVMEKVMGYGRPLPFDPMVPRYSTDLMEAWEIVRKFGAELSVGRVTCVATIGIVEDNGRGEMEIKRFDAYSEEGEHSAPHAICLAALKAVGALPEEARP